MALTVEGTVTESNPTQLRNAELASVTTVVLIVMSPLQQARMATCRM